MQNKARLELADYEAVSKRSVSVMSSDIYVLAHLTSPLCSLSFDLPMNTIVFSVTLVFSGVFFLLVYRD